MFVGVLDHRGQGYCARHPPATVLGDDLTLLELDVVGEALPAWAQTLDPRCEHVECGGVVGQRLGS